MKNDNPPFIVVIADDDPDDHVMIKDALLAVNKNLIIFNVFNGKDLLLWLESNIYPHLIMMDLNMPIMDGLGALRKIKSNPDYAQISIFMLSTSASDYDKQSAKKLGIIDFYTKPYTFDNLKAIIKDAYNRTLGSTFPK